MKLAHRLEGVSESATLKLNALVQSLKASGESVINLTAGEPDFAVPAIAQSAIVDAMKANKSKYTPVPGIPELRDAVAARTNAQQPSLSAAKPWKGTDVVVSNGGKQAIFNALMTLVNPGDEILIPAPYWLSYPEMSKLVGGVPKILSTRVEEGFRLKPETLREALGARSRILFINSPSNPTGATLSKDEMRALAQVILDFKDRDSLWVISDEIYDEVVLQPDTQGKSSCTSFLEAAPELRDRTITINGMSKSAAMTGWRIGWSVASQALTPALITVQGQSTSGINALAQWASLAALRASGPCPSPAYEAHRQSYRRRRDLVLEKIKKHRKIKVHPPEGAFYAFLGVGAYFRPGEGSIGFCERVLAEAKVALVPGGPFGADEFVRLSFAVEESELLEGLERIGEFLGK